jgi:hypothetical protein
MDKVHRKGQLETEAVFESLTINIKLEEVFLINIMPGLCKRKRCL